MNVKYDNADMWCDEEKQVPWGKAIAGSYVSVAQMMSGFFPTHELKMVTPLLYIMKQNHREIE